MNQPHANYLPNHDSTDSTAELAFASKWGSINIPLGPKMTMGIVSNSVVKIICSMIPLVTPFKGSLINPESNGTCSVKTTRAVLLDVSSATGRDVGGSNDVQLCPHQLS